MMPNTSSSIGTESLADLRNPSGMNNFLILITKDGRLKAGIAIGSKIISDRLIFNVRQVFIERETIQGSIKGE
nr:unnamed protein product [Callosobruchus analis]